MNRNLIPAKYSRFIIFLVLTLLVLLSTLPYFNIILSPQLIFILFLAFFIVMFDYGGEIVSFVILIFVISSLIFSLLFENSIAEKLGNYIYFLLLINFLVILVRFIKDFKK